MFNKLLIALVVFIFVVYSCKKDPIKNEDKKPEKSRSELITASLWKITSIVTDGTDIWNSPFPIIPACNKDNTYNFGKDNILTTYDNTSKCNSTDPDSTSGPYALVNNNTRIYMKFNVAAISIDDTVDIIELSEETLKINAKYMDIPATLTFKHN